MVYYISLVLCFPTVAVPYIIVEDSRDSNCTHVASIEGTLAPVHIGFKLLMGISHQNRNMSYQIIMLGKF